MAKPAEKPYNSTSRVFDAEHLCLSYQATDTQRHSKSVTDMIYAITLGYSQDCFQPTIDRKIRIFRKKNNILIKKNVVWTGEENEKE